MSLGPLSVLAGLEAHYRLVDRRATHRVERRESGFQSIIHSNTFTLSVRILEENTYVIYPCIELYEARRPGEARLVILIYIQIGDMLSPFKLDEDRRRSSLTKTDLRRQQFEDIHTHPKL